MPARVRAAIKLSRSTSPSETTAIQHSSPPSAPGIAKAAQSPTCGGRPGRSPAHRAAPSGPGR
jgi:hypothetical protein